MNSVNIDIITHWYQDYDYKKFEKEYHNFSKDFKKFIDSLKIVGSRFYDKVDKLKQYYEIKSFFLHLLNQKEIFEKIKTEQLQKNLKSYFADYEYRLFKVKKILDKNIFPNPEEKEIFQKYYEFLRLQMQLFLSKKLDEYKITDEIVTEEIVENSLSDLLCKL